MLPVIWAAGRGAACAVAPLRAAPAACAGGMRRHLAAPAAGGPPAAAAADDLPTTEYIPRIDDGVGIIHKLGLDVLQDPTVNKGTAFPLHERERLGLRGLLPAAVSTMDIQHERIKRDIEFGLDQIPPEAMGSGITREMERKWRVLQGLQARNETLFYRVLVDQFVDLAPIVYTPTVGWVCSNFHTLWRRPQGMFFSLEDKGQMASMVYNWPVNDVSAIVVTDGSRILGLGDLGVNGLGIAIGKLDLYVAAAGFHPNRVLPVVIDVGTNNQRLLNDPLYVGLRRPRARGKEYYDTLDEFVSAVTSRWPDAVLQFEDFSIEHALPLLQRYREHHLVFNDDIQGTAATAVAALYGALRTLGRPPADITQQRVVCVGAGSAGMGVVTMIARAMEAHGLSAEQAAANFWVLDKDGLVTHARSNLPPHVARFARPDAASEGASLLDTVEAVKPTVLLGLSGAGRLFTEAVLKEAAAHVERPIIFPMSNPTAKMECTAQEAIAATDGRCVFAGGSPQSPFDWGGRHWENSQANNLFTFPGDPAPPSTRRMAPDGARELRRMPNPAGMALGSFLGQTHFVSDHMFMAAAEEIPNLISQEDLDKGLVLPRIKSIREISAAVAAAVMKAAHKDGHLNNPDARDALGDGDAAFLNWVKRNMYSPHEYTALTYRPPGIGE